MNLDTYYKEIENELKNNILPFWNKTIDEENGGFLGRILNNGEIIKNSPKSAVFNTRILWTYSAVYRRFKEGKYLELAKRAYEYIKEYFKDKEKGGIYWILDYKGIPTNRRKQIYAQAFCVYALAEYYKIVRNKDVLNWARELFELIEKHSYDPDYPGYFEACDREWNPIEDVRLSEKDQNEKKTMNTHLHILEGYASLLSIWEDENLANHLKILINIFLDKIIDSKTWHLNLFFDELWNLKSNLLSYGHDIEGSWLLCEAAEILNDKDLLERVQKSAVEIANTVLSEGIDLDGALMNEGQKDGITDTDKHWWPQAESMVGFLNAFQISGDKKFLEASYNCWDFVKKHIIDYKNGDWFFRVNRKGIPYLTEEDKLGPWKASYHNSRCCLELMERLKKIK
jgi:mannobiose 2-epimerase